MDGRVFPLAVAFCCTAVLYAQNKNPYENVGKEVRQEAIRHAQVWTPGDIASKDIRVGPQDVAAFAPDAVVTCDYVEKRQKGTPKFDCVIAPDDKIRVKYGAANGEIYAEVAASRLLWALGFGVDRVYPVQKVVCNGCPADPMKSYAKAPGTRDFTAVAIERKLPGDEMDENAGWSWGELTFVDQTSGGAPFVQRDALRLLAAMIQHTDNKPEQQRLACLDRTLGLAPQMNGSCQHSFMLINDLGKTFGKATVTNEDERSAVNFEAWSRTPIWKDANACVAHLSKSFSGSLEHPKISEGGRQFLSNLLAQLSDAQLRDLFEVARFTQRDSTRSVDDWIAVFKQKRDEIASVRCTNPAL